MYTILIKGSLKKFFDEPLDKFIYFFIILVKKLEEGGDSYGSMGSI
jgi:hypothetical protein